MVILLEEVEVTSRTLRALGIRVGISAGVFRQQITGAANGKSSEMITVIGERNVVFHEMLLGRNKMFLASVGEGDGNGWFHG